MVITLTYFTSSAPDSSTVQHSHCREASKKKWKWWGKLEGWSAGQEGRKDLYLFHLKDARGMKRFLHTKETTNKTLSMARNPLNEWREGLTIWRHSNWPVFKGLTNKRTQNLLPTEGTCMQRTTGGAGGWVTKGYIFESKMYVSDDKRDVLKMSSQYDTVHRTTAWISEFQVKLLIFLTYRLQYKPANMNSKW